MRAWFGAVNAHDLAAYADAATEDYRWELWDASTVGREPSVESWRSFLEAFPDLSITMDSILSDVGKAAARWTMRGTHRGPLRFRGTASMEEPIPPTGRAFEVRGGGFWDVRDGRVSASFAYWQPQQMLEQLGVRPAGASSGR